MTEILEILNKIVAALRNKEVPVPDAVKTHRMADFAALGWTIAGVIDWQDGYTSVLQAMHKERSEFLFENDPLIIAIDLWLKDENNNSREVTAGVLFEELKKVMEPKGEVWTYRNSRSLGKRLNIVLSDLQHFFSVSKRKTRVNQQVYQFSQKDNENRVDK